MTKQQILTRLEGELKTLKSQKPQLKALISDKNETSDRKIQAKDLIKKVEIAIIKTEKNINLLKLQI